LAEHLGRDPGLAVAEGDPDRALQQVLELLVTRLHRGAAGQGVLDHPVLDRLGPQAAPQVLQLSHGQTAIIGQHGYPGALQLLREQLDLLYLVWSCHKKTSGLQTGTEADWPRSGVPRQEIKTSM